MPTSHLEQADKLITFVHANSLKSVDVKYDRWTSWDAFIHVNGRQVLRVSNVAVDLAEQQLRKHGITFNTI